MPVVRKLWRRWLPLLRRQLPQRYHAQREEDIETLNTSTATPNTATIERQAWGSYRDAEYLWCNAQYHNDTTPGVSKIQRRILPLLQPQYRNDTTANQRKIQRRWIPLLRRWILQRYHARCEEDTAILNTSTATPNTAAIHHPPTLPVEVHVVEGQDFDTLLLQVFQVLAEVLLVVLRLNVLIRISMCHNSELQWYPLKLFQEDWRRYASGW